MSLSYILGETRMEKTSVYKYEKDFALKSNSQIYVMTMPISNIDQTINYIPKVLNSLLEATFMSVK